VRLTVFRASVDTDRTNRVSQYDLVCNVQNEMSLQATSAVASATKAFPGSGPDLATSRGLSGAARDSAPSNSSIGNRSSRTAYSPIVLAGVVRIIEVALVALVGCACWLWCITAPDEFVHYLNTVVGISLLTVVTFQSADLYELQILRGYVRQSVRFTLAWSVVFASVAALSHFAQLNDVSAHFWLSAYYLSGLVVLIGFRAVTSFLVRYWTRQGRFERLIVIVGAGDRGDALIANLLAERDSDVRVIGVFDDRSDDRTGGVGNGVPKLGGIDDLLEFARHTRVDLVIVALPVTAEERILQMLKKLWVLPLDIRLAAHGSKLQFRPRSYSYIGKVPVFDIFDRPIAGWDVVAKWIFDKIVGVVAFICLAPIMLAIAVAIKIDSNGPVLFRQRRYGFNNKTIDVYKFRSMYVEHTDATARRLVTRNDSRVTRVGRIIRRTSLDELPQLFNVVFKGNLSLVGPRPHAVHAKADEQLYDEVVDGYFARHRVKPGITGWAQINGWRGETDSKEKIRGRVEHDLYYIENWSILFDLWILARTPIALTRGDGAY
jgi:Undecaprenyl-phosphate glucose phosphotransferase